MRLHSVSIIARCNKSCCVHNAPAKYFVEIDGLARNMTARHASSCHTTYTTPVTVTSSKVTGSGLYSNLSLSC